MKQLTRELARYGLKAVDFEREKPYLHAKIIVTGGVKRSNSIIDRTTGTKTMFYEIIDEEKFENNFENIKDMITRYAHRKNQIASYRPVPVNAPAVGIKRTFFLIEHALKRRELH
ncbi:MAG: hypothetical protein NTY90_05145 [Candidatus Micrarchaeota archaeon]|nr:hypothetical protein [Candidatus Micrarchaeota archaeon]